MNSFIYSLLPVSIAFAALYVVYFLFFRNLTFFRTNRAILLSIIPLSLLTPFVGNSLLRIPVNNIYLPKFEEFIPVAQNTATVQHSLLHNISADTFIIILYCAGFAIFAIRLVLSAFMLIRLRRKSKVVKDSHYTIIYAPVAHIFSCFNWIFVPGNTSTQVEDAVLEHEKNHARLGHTVDLVLTEFFVLLFWFNPLVYFYRKSLKSVHEFQVDSLIVKSGVKKSKYLQLILENINSESRLNGLLNYFNTTSIKNRVKMITKNKSAKLKKLRYLILVPAIALLTLSFSKQDINPVAQIAQVVIQAQWKPELNPITTSDNKGITNKFGIRFKNPITKVVATHNGIDIKANEGVSVLASADGTAAKVIYDERWGNLVIIDHGAGYQTWYAHLKGFNIKEGETVQKGQIIGFVGTTGSSTGYHLHFEVHLNGKPVDPMNYIK